MLKVISFNICPFVQRVTALLELKEIPYEVEYIRLNDKPDWFKEVSPNGQVPVLITESGTPLFESDAIVEYLEEKHPTMYPGMTAEQKAINRAWSYLATKHYLVQCSAQRSPSRETLMQREAKLSQAFTRMENALTQTPFFHSDSVGMVDIAWLPLLHRAKIMEECSGYNFLTPYPKLKQWQTILLKTGLAERSVSSDFITKFTDFYLSADTYLGKGSDCSGSADEACGTGTCC